MLVKIFPSYISSTVSTMSELMSFLRLFAPASSSASTASDTRRQVLTRLKFMGSLSPHEKIDSRSLKIESTSFLTPLKRWLFTGDSRETAVYFFSSTIDRAFEIVSAHIHSKNVSEQIFCANIIQDLFNSVKGLRAAQKTYADDKLIVCELEVLVETVSGKLFEIQKSHPHLFTMKELCVVQIKGNNEKREQSLDGEMEDSVPTLKPPGGSLHAIREEDDDDDGKMP